MTAEEAVLRRIRTRAAWIGGVSAGGAFFFGWRAGISLTICAAVVIFSFLVFERLTGRLVTPPGRKRFKAMLPLLLVTAAAIALLIVVLRWKAFNPIAGAVGLSAVVLAIGAEIFERK